MKKIYIITFIVVAITTLITFFVLYNSETIDEVSEVKLRVDGQKTTVLVEKRDNNKFIVSIEPLLKKLDIEYNIQDTSFYINNSDDVIKLKLNNKEALVNDIVYELDNEYFIIEGNHMVPLEFLTVHLNLDYNYDNDLEIINVETRSELLMSYKQALDIFIEDKVALITDVETGISYNVKRVVGGFNTLADVETLTIEDTEKLLSTCGNEWNIKRRAVIVEVDGTKIAASIAPFPHSGRDDAPFGSMVDNRSGATGRGINLNSITDNGMVGVVDVFFYNSVIPGINRIDERHQEMVIKASKSK